MKWMTEEQAGKLLIYLRDHTQAAPTAKEFRTRHAVYTVATIMFYCGLRLAEAIAVRRQDIVVETSTRIDDWLYVRGKRAILPGPAKNGYDRRVPCHFEAREVITRFPYSEIADCVSARTVQRHWTAAVQACGLPIKWSPHSARHTFARLAYVHCRDISAVQRLLGHRCVSSTLIYTVADDKALLNASGNLYYKDAPDTCLPIQPTHLLPFSQKPPSNSSCESSSADTPTSSSAPSKNTAPDASQSTKAPPSPSSDEED